MSKCVVWTNGCFDCINANHIECLEFAKAQGDILIVGINTDESIKRLKGPIRPFLPLVDRIKIIHSLWCVDHVVPFAEDTPYNLIDWIRPNKIVKGDDYKIGEHCRLGTCWETQCYFISS